MPFVISFVQPSAKASYFSYLNSQNLPFGEGDHLEDFAPFFRDHVRLLEPLPFQIQTGNDEQAAEPKPPTGFGDEEVRKQLIQVKTDVGNDDDDVRYCEPPPVLPSFLKITRSFEELKPLDRGPIGFDCSETINLEPGFENEGVNPGEDLSQGGGEIDVGGNDESMFDDYTFNGYEYVPVKPEPVNDYNSHDLPVINNADVEHILGRALVDEDEVEAAEQTEHKPLVNQVMEQAVNFTMKPDEDAMAAALELEKPLPVLEVAVNNDDDLTNILAMLPVKPPPADDENNETQIVSAQRRPLPRFLAQDAVDDYDGMQDDDDAIAPAYEPKRTPRSVSFKSNVCRNRENGRFMKRDTDKQEARKSSRLDARNSPRERVSKTPKVAKSRKAQKEEKKTPQSRVSKRVSFPVSLARFACPRCHHEFSDNYHLKRHEKNVRPCTPVGNPRSSSRKSVLTPQKSPGSARVNLSSIVAKEKLPAKRGRPKSVPAKRFNGIHAFACVACEMSFAYYFELKRHQQIHQ